jgi:hypothetical protein
MSDFEIGFLGNNLKIIEDGYKKVAEVYDKISFYSIDDIKRCHPVYWKQYIDCEREIDKNGEDLHSEGYRVIMDKIVQIWENIGKAINEEFYRNLAKGMPLPSKKDPEYVMTLYRMDSSTQEIVSVGFLTAEEMKDWREKKVTVAELQKRNIDDYDVSIGHRASTEQLIGPLALQDDGTGDRKFSWKKNMKLSEQSFGDLQASAIMAPDPIPIQSIRAQEKQQKAIVPQPVAKLVKSDIEGYDEVFEMELP